VSWFTRIRNIFRSDSISDEIDREISFHLDERADELMAAGVPAGEAHREARRRFGSVTLQKEHMRDRDVLVWLETLTFDLRQGLRGLRRDPIFCLTAILTLAIGIGATTAVFTLLHGLLLRSLPVASPQELVRIDHVSLTQPKATGSLSHGMVQQLRRQQRSFVDISSWENMNQAVEDPDGTVRFYTSALVSGNGFDVLGLQPRLGRLLTPADDLPGGGAAGWAAVLSESYWRERYGADPGVLGSTLKIRGELITIVGVAPAAFHGVFPGFEPKIYLPLRFFTVITSREMFDAPRSPFAFATIARLKPGVSIEEATAELGVYVQPLVKEFGMADPPWQRIFASSKLTLESARTGLPSFFGRRYSKPLYLMQGLVAIVLLLCCVNVSGLMLSKLHERQQEFAVRTAIGAGRTRLMRQQLMESFVIALAGSALGAAGAWYGSGLLLSFFRDPNFEMGMDLQPDRTVFLVTAGLAVFTTLFFGLAPAWRAGRANPGSLLKARTAAQGQRAGRGFVAVQIALSLMLVVPATLLSQSLGKLRGEPTGFDVDHVTIQMPPFHLLPQKRDAKLDLYQQMIDRITQAPGVDAAAVTFFTPMTGFQATAKFQPMTEGAAAAADLTLSFNHAGPGYFRTMKTPMIAGREFERNERTRDVCVVNQSAAAALFPGQSAIGRYVQTRDQLMGMRGPAVGPGRKPRETPVICRVIGVATDAKFASLREPPPRTIYYPAVVEVADSNLVFLINAQTKSAAVSGYREALREIAPAAPLEQFATLREQMDAALGSQRAITMLSNFFGLVALLLSAIGLYGMLSANVAQRTGEIGIRVALGASRGAILRMVLSDAFRLVAIGAVLGAVALYFTVATIRHMLYGVSAFDPVTLAVSCLLLALVVFVAAYTPARRAASVDPMQAIRAE
jgi:predicted permease